MQLHTNCHVANVELGEEKTCALPRRRKGGLDLLTVREADDADAAAGWLAATTDDDGILPAAIVELDATGSRMTAGSTPGKDSGPG